MTGLTSCPNECGTLIEPDRLACRECVNRLPADERKRVEAEHRRQRDHVFRHHLTTPQGAPTTTAF
jgi:hypothetical protein